MKRVSTSNGRMTHDEVAAHCPKRSKNGRCTSKTWAFCEAEDCDVWAWLKAQKKTQKGKR